MSLARARPIPRSSKQCSQPTWAASCSTRGPARCSARSASSIAKSKLDRQVNAPNENEQFLIVNAQPLEGKFDVKEGFAEFALPLFKTDQQFLDLNAAARFTDYSTVGSVTTWKAGLVYSPVEQLRFRGTLSRDIRAPSIGETFVKNVLLFSNISNPFLPDTDHEFDPDADPGQPGLEGRNRARPRRSVSCIPRAASGAPSTGITSI